MAKVALVHPVITDRRGEHYPGHLGLSFVSSHLKENGNSVVYANMASSDSGEGIIKTVKEFRPDFVGVTVQRDYVDLAAEMIARVRMAAKKAVYVVGGPGATRDPEKILRATQADYVVIGDGVPTMQHIIDQNLDAPGIGFLDKKKFVSTGPAKYNPNAWSVDPDAFSSKWYAFPIISSVGCAYKMSSFCDLRNVFPKTRARDIAAVVNDMKLLAKKDPLRFSMVDDDFLVNRGRTVQLDRAMAQAGLEQHVSFLTRADNLLWEENYLWASRQRYDRTTIGIESFLKPQLDRWKKGTTPEQNHAAIELLRKMGIEPIIYMIVGDEKSDMGEFEQVSEVFSEHPEYLHLLSGGVLLGRYEYKEDPLESYDEYALVYGYFFHRLFSAFNSKEGESASKKLMQAFMDGKQVSEGKKKGIREVFRIVHGAMESSIKGEIDFNVGKLIMERLVGRMSNLITNLYS